MGCIYIGPLKALINDQFARLNDLCEEADIPVWHWHGDVAQSHKARLMKRPSGILQITPESLEAMLLHKHGAIASLFGDLRFVVIDEVHRRGHLNGPEAFPAVAVDVLLHEGGVVVEDVHGKLLIGLFDKLEFEYQLYRAGWCSLRYRLCC